MKPVALALAVLLAAGPALADSAIEISDPYARGGAGAPTGAAFMVIRNSGDTDDRLIGLRYPDAARAEIHEHVMEDGVMRMRPKEGGIAVPAGGEAVLERGGDHLMFMGLQDRFEDGETVTLTLIFEKAGEVEVTFAVDSARGAHAME